MYTVLKTFWDQPRGRFHNPGDVVQFTDEEVLEWQLLETGKVKAKAAGAQEEAPVVRRGRTKVEE
jgi:hypothetical protein